MTPGIAAKTDGRSAIADVHRDFHAIAQVNGFWGFPLHGRSPKGCVVVGSIV
jgi:hypothetical protein